MRPSEYETPPFNEFGDADGERLQWAIRVLGDALDEILYKQVINSTSPSAVRRFLLRPKSSPLHELEIDYEVYHDPQTPTMGERLLRSYTLDINSRRSEQHIRWRMNQIQTREGATAFKPYFFDYELLKNFRATHNRAIGRLGVFSDPTEADILAASSWIREYFTESGDSRLSEP